MAISTRDYCKILEIIDIIYSVPDKSAMFSAVSNKLQKLLHIYSAIFIPANSKTGEFLLNGYEIFHNSEKSMLAYLTHYAPLDPFVSGGWINKQVNEVMSITEVMSESRMMKSEYVYDFLMRLSNRIFYIMGSVIFAQGDKVGVIGLHRQKTQGDFTRNDKKIVNILFPHMARAIRNHQLMNGLDLTKESCGVIAVGENGKPFYMNEPAKLALKNKPITAIPEPGLGSYLAFFKGGGGIYRVRTVPLGKKNIGKVILLERHPPEHKISPKLMEFHLSRREE